MAEGRPVGDARDADEDPERPRGADLLAEEEAARRYCASGVSCSQTAASPMESAPYASVMSTCAAYAASPITTAIAQAAGPAGQGPSANGSATGRPPRQK